MDRYDLTVVAMIDHDAFETGLYVTYFGPGSNLGTTHCYMLIPDSRDDALRVRREMEERP